MHLAEPAEVLEVLVQRVVQLLALVERLKVRGAHARDARLLHDVLDVDPEEVVDVHVPVEVADDRVLEAEGGLDVAEVAVGEVEPRAWRDVPGEYDLQVEGCGPCSEPHRAGGGTYEGCCCLRTCIPLSLNRSSCTSSQSNSSFPGSSSSCGTHPPTAVATDKNERSIFCRHGLKRGGRTLVRIVPVQSVQTDNGKLAGDDLTRIIPSVLKDLVLREGDERAPDVGEFVGDAIWSGTHDIMRPGRVSEDEKGT